MNVEVPAPFPHSQEHILHPFGCLDRKCKDALCDSGDSSLHVPDVQANTITLASDDGNVHKWLQYGLGSKGAQRKPTCVKLVS
jgi:hypothetical protein